jgi:hypothetical protein
MLEVWAVILAIYGLSIGLVHLLAARYHWGRRDPAHAVIVTHDHGAYLEWYLRSFAIMEDFRACDTKVTILDEGSEDETVQIAQRIIHHRNSANWEVVALSSTEEAEQWLQGVSAKDRIAHVIRL